MIPRTPAEPPGAWVPDTNFRLARQCVVGYLFYETATGGGARPPRPFFESATGKNVHIRRRNENVSADDAEKTSSISSN